MSVLQTSIDGRIATILLDRPDKRNALSAELVAGIHNAILTLDANESVSVIVIRGAGPSFCAGADLEYLQQISQYSVLENMADSTALKNMLQSIVTCSKPVIAMVHGPAIAGGCGLASVCDIVIAASSSARFGYPEVKIGFIPAIVLVYLVRKIGDTQARRLLLTGETINSIEAHRLGLVTHVVADEELELFTMELAATLSSNSSSSMALTKMMMNNVHGMSLDAGLHYATVMNAVTRQTTDCKDGIQRFLNSSKG